MLEFLKSLFRKKKQGVDKEMSVERIEDSELYKSIRSELRRIPHWNRIKLNDKKRLIELCMSYKGNNIIQYAISNMNGSVLLETSQDNIDLIKLKSFHNNLM